MDTRSVRSSGLLLEGDELTQLRTEEEQLEALKRWWSAHGFSLLAVILVALALGWGYRLWQDHIEARGIAASTLFQDLLDLVEAEDGRQLNEEQRSTADYVTEQLKAEYASHAYSRMAALLAARLAVDQGDLSGAEMELRWITTREPEDEIGSLARIRLARVLLALERVDEGLPFLEGDFTYYSAQAAETRGDLLRAAGRRQEAYEAYLEARSNQPGGVGNPFLEMKVADLAPPQTSEGARPVVRELQDASQEETSSPGEQSDDGAPATEGDSS